jgi:hypothetical protein
VATIKRLAFIFIIHWFYFVSPILTTFLPKRLTAIYFYFYIFYQQPVLLQCLRPGKNNYL